jgi:diaminopimelate decarboxylase
MHQFAVGGRRTAVGGEPLSTLAARVGSTPFYAYDRSLLRARVAELRARCPPASWLHYAMKANPMPAVVGFMAGLVDGIDVASAGELKVALDAGADRPRSASPAPASATPSSRRRWPPACWSTWSRARTAGAGRGVAGARLPARVAVRVNPDFELKGSGMKMGGGPKQFGIDVEQVPAVLAQIGRAGAGLRGLPPLRRLAEPARRVDLRGAAPRATSWRCGWPRMRRRRCAS